MNTKYKRTNKIWNKIKDNQMGNDRAFGGLRAESQENLVTQSWEVRRTVKKASPVLETRSETDWYWMPKWLLVLSWLLLWIPCAIIWLWGLGGFDRFDSPAVDIIWYKTLTEYHLNLNLNLCMIWLEEKYSFIHITHWSTMKMKIWIARSFSAPWKMCAMHMQCYARFG